MKTIEPLYSLLIVGLASICVSGCAAQGTQLGNAASNPQTPASQNESVPASDTHPALLDTTLAQKTAPEKPFKVKFETTKGDFVVEVTRSWSPNGADRFYNMVDIGYFNKTVVFRAIRGFMFQFGIHGDPAVNDQWGEFNFNDDRGAGTKSNLPGYITFAKTGAPNSRSTQMFINLGNNVSLDAMGFTPFGKVVEGMDVVNAINTRHGENPPNIQAEFKRLGNPYILKEFPDLDIIKSVTFVEE